MTETQSQPSFARRVWRLLVAIKDGLALILLLLFFGVLYAALSGRSSPASVKEGALLLSFKGAIVEEPAFIDPLEQLLEQQAPAREYRARDVVRALTTAAEDDRIKAVVLDLSELTGAGMVHLQEIGEAMDKVRAAKKPVLTYATAYIDDGLLLAAHSSEVWVDPLGGAFILGPGGKNLYYGKLLEKLKITAHVFRVGTYKSAVEPYIRSDMSPESKQAANALAGALWDSWKADVLKARPKANIDLASQKPVEWLKASGGDGAKAALAAGLVDKIGDSVTFGKRVAEIVGEDDVDSRPGKFAYNRLSTWLAANPLSESGRPIGVITIAGPIVDGEEGPGVAGGDRIAEALDEAQSEDLAALVVRVNSPGGSVLASERIRTAIERWKAKGVPVVVSMANVAASGGYWVATPASRIFAEPATITGSIGIFAVVPSFERALGDWGINTDGVQTTPLSGQPDLVGGLSPEISGMVQSNIENGYSRFLALVAKSRGKTPEQIDAIAQGRVWDGGTARQNGLVDQFGGLDDALAYAAKEAKLADGEWHAAYLGQMTDPLGDLVGELTGSGDRTGSGGAQGDLAGLAKAQQMGLIDRVLGEVKRLVSTGGAQAYCLECPVQPGSLGTDRRNREGFWARLLGI